MTDEELFGTPVLDDKYDIVGDKIRTEVTDKERVQAPVGSASDADQGRTAPPLRSIVHTCLPMRLEIGPQSSTNSQSAVTDNEDAGSSVSAFTSRSINSSATTHLDDIPVSVFPATGGEQLFQVTLPNLADYCANWAGVKQMGLDADVSGRPGSDSEKCWAVDRHRGTVLSRP